MNNYCKENRCIRCCLGTTMPLSNNDIKRIKKLGFDINFFVTEKDGWLQLKNQDGRCVFHNSMMCTIYENRPDGCKLYPIIFDRDDNHAVFDKDCPHRAKFQMSEGIKKQLYDIVSKLEIERAERN